MSLSFVALYASQPELTVEVLEALGVQFVPKQHGKCPLRFAYTASALTLEVFPARSSTAGQYVMLGFTVSDLQAAHGSNSHARPSPLRPAHGRATSCSLNADGEIIRFSRG